MRRAVALVRTITAPPAEYLRVAIVCGSATALIAAGRALPLLPGF